MKLMLRGDGQGINLQFQLSWRVTKAFAVALAALIAMPEVSHLIALFGW